jgi:acyl-coenzyme A thioesterase PaaI-like protein
MTDRPPTGYEPVSLGEGFNAVLGTVYADRTSGALMWRVGADHANPAGVCHGGALASFADAQIVASRGAVDAWEVHTPTITLSVDYLAPIPLGAWVHAAVTIDRTTRTMIFSRATFTVEGDVVGRSTAIYRNPSKPGPTP